MNTLIKIIINICIVFSLFSISLQTKAFTLPNSKILLEGGVHAGQSGKTQNIYIQDLLGDKFSATKNHDNSYLVGAGFLLDGYNNDYVNISYGINGFYFGKTKTAGTIKQEFLYDNLAYSYKTSHLPLYATVKTDINKLFPTEKYQITVDAGVGPSFNTTSNYKDWSIDDGITFPDNAFNGHSSTKLSAMGGLGVKINNAIKQYPVELSYKVFYLGKTNLTQRTSQILNSLTTGSNYSQALVVTLIV